MLDGFCLVYFEEPEAVDVVCRRPHRIDEQDLDVKIYYECLGQVDSDDEPFKPPSPLEISDFDPKKLQFLIKSPPNQQAVEKQLEAVHGKPIWPKKSKSNSLTVECTLTPETKDCRKLARHWETKVKENLNKFLDLLHVSKHSTLQEAFSLVLNELKSLTISNPDAVAVVLEKSNHEIYVTGHKQAVTDVSKQVSDIIVKVDQELDRKKQQVQEEKLLKRHLVLILQFCKFEQELQKKYKDISLKYDISKNLVKFEGLSGEVTSAIVEMYEFTSKVVKTEVKQFSKLLQQFLQQQPVYMYVNSKMKERNIIGIWEFCKGEETLTVFSMSDQQAVQAAHLIKESVIETPIKLANEATALLPTREWQSKVEEIEQTGQGLVKIMAQADQGRIIILCTDQWEGLAREYIEDFMLTNTIYEESLNLEPAMMRYLQMNCASDLQNVGDNLQQEKVNVVVNNTGIVIKATKTGLNQAKYAIDKIVKAVEKQTHSINKAGIRKHMESTAGQEKLRKVERSEGVVIEVSDESASDEDTSSSWLTTGANRQELAVCVTKEGKKISAMVVDMLELDVDVIVNPANKDMKHIGGIAKFIVEKGGRSIQDECNDYVRKKGRLMEGQVYLSAAGNLKCKGVIHAVGPVWQNGTNQEEEYLREAVFKSLEVTSERRLTSIAFPALCTGVFGYPVREATRVIVVAVRDFFKENLGSTVEAVYLCDVKVDNVNGFVAAMKRELKDVTVKSPEHGSHWKSGKTPVPAARKTVKVVPVAAGNITIHIVKGQISKQKVDVVVNTTSKDLKLGNGAVSASLLKAGGSILQQECDQNYPQGIQHGDIAVTSGGNLYCQSICHGSLPGWDPQGKALTVLRAFMEKCLAHVDQNQHSSVAFPAMGTGNLGYPRETVAKEMFSIVYNFGSSNPNTTISDVYFVLYDRDTETVKAFETEERRQGGGGGGGRHGRQLGPRSRDPSFGQSSGFMEKRIDNETFEWELNEGPRYFAGPYQTKQESILRGSYGNPPLQKQRPNFDLGEYDDELDEVGDRIQHLPSRTRHPASRLNRYRRMQSSPDLQGHKATKPTLQKSISSPRINKVYSSDWLDDTVMDKAMEIVKKSYPNIKGLQETCVASVHGQHGLNRQPGNFLQIINTQGNHWILLTNMGWDHHHVRVFDSCYRKLNPDTRNCIAALVPAQNNTIKVLMPTYQRQENRSDCGLFAVAAMFALALGKDPSKCYWDSNRMRPFLLECLQSKTCRPFPPSSTQVNRLREKEYDITICHKCQSFPSDNPAVGLCSVCQNSFDIFGHSSDIY